MKDYLERKSCNWSEDSITLINTCPLHIRQAFLFIQEAGCFMTYPPYFTERENLDNFLCIYTLSGRGRLIYRGQEYVLEKGDFFFINCMERHLYQCDGPKWDFLWFHFKGANAAGYFEEATRRSFHVVRFEDTDGIEGRIRQMFSLLREKEAFSDVLISRIITDILTEVIIRNTETGTMLSPMPQLIRDVMRVIEKKYRDEISLDFLSASYNISKYHLSREFKKYTGQNIHEYQISLRLNYAKELLRRSDETVEEIAYSCGMNNVSHFISLFKSREHKTPLQYRRDWMGDQQQTGPV